MTIVSLRNYSKKATDELTDGLGWEDTKNEARQQLTTSEKLQHKLNVDEGRKQCVRLT